MFKKSTVCVPVHGVQPKEKNAANNQDLCVIDWSGDYSSYSYHSKKDIYGIKVCGDLSKFF